MSEMPIDPTDQPSDNNRPSDELTQEGLQAKLAAYQEAIKAEYELNTADNPDAKEMEEMTQDFFRKAAPSAAAQIFWISQNSTSDATRLSASKYIIERGFKEEGQTGDPIKQLLKELAGNDKTKTKTTS